MSDLFGSAVNRIAQVQQVRETTLEAVAANADTGEVYRGAAAVYQLHQGRFSASSRISRESRGDSSSPSSGTTSATPLMPSSANARLQKVSNIFDVSDSKERAMLRATVTNRSSRSKYLAASSGLGAHQVAKSMPNRRVQTAWIGGASPTSLQRGEDTTQPQDHEVGWHGTTYGSEEKRTLSSEGVPEPLPDEAIAEVEAAEAVANAVPFPVKAVLSIVVSQLLSIAPVVIFAAISPYLYGVLVGDLQTAGTVSSIAAGLSMMLQVLLTPVLAQVMDLYGRRKLAIFSCVKSLMVCLPLLVAGVVIHEGQKDVSDLPEDENDINAKLGGYLSDGARAFVHALFILYWALSLLASASNSSHSLVAIADVCQSQQHRCMAIGVYAGLANLLAVFAIVGSHFSLMLGGITSVGIGGIGLIFTLIMMPETIDLSAPRKKQKSDEPYAEATATAKKCVEVLNPEGEKGPSACLAEEGDLKTAAAVHVVSIDAPVVVPLSSPKSVVRDRQPRLSIYPSQIRERENHQGSRLKRAAQPTSATTTTKTPMKIENASASTTTSAAVFNSESSSRGSSLLPLSSDLNHLREREKGEESIYSDKTVATATEAATFDESRRIHVCSSPFKGFSLIRRSRSSVIALAVLFSCLMAEISASDTLVYYLSITLGFGPDDVSYLQIERATLSLVVCTIIGPLLTKFISCARQCMLCALFIAAALITLAAADSKAIIFAVYVPCASMASIMIPSVAAVITKDASTPEDVSLSMSTVMSLVALLQAGGSFFAALVFKLLNKDTLWVTFVISAAFTVPMFVLSVMLEVACRKEAADAEAAKTKHEEKEADHTDTSHSVQVDS